MDFLVRGVDSVRVTVPSSLSATASGPAGRRGTAVKCLQDGCMLMHRRSGGYCAQHEAAWKKMAEQDEEENTLLPAGAEPAFLDMGGYGLVRNGPDHRFAIFLVTLRCAASGASWTVYRRYQEFQVSVVLFVGHHNFVILVAVPGSGVGRSWFSYSYTRSWWLKF